MQTMALHFLIPPHCGIILHFRRHTNLFNSFLVRDRYYTNVAWISQTEISVVWLNRQQNLSVVSLCKSPMWHCQEVSVVCGCDD